jgi:hypothetical protein
LVTEDLDNANDILNLGWAFLEMETVRMQKSREAMWDFLSQDTLQKFNETSPVDDTSDATSIPQPASNSNTSDETKATSDPASQHADGSDTEEIDMTTEDDTSTYVQLSWGHSNQMQYRDPKVLANLPDWMTKLCNDDSPKKYCELIKSMVHTDSGKRPTAYEVLCATIRIPDWTHKPMCGEPCIQDHKRSMKAKSPIR